MDKTTRAYVLESLIKIYIDSGYGNRITDSVLDEGIDKVSSGFFTRLFYGCLENNIYLDYILRQNIKTSVNKLNPYIHYILIMAFYQFLFMDSVPDHAIVDESVKLAKKYQKRYSGFVNGVLRGFLRRHKKIMLPKKTKEPIRYLSVVYSHPKWLVSMWIEQYGYDFTEKLLMANQKKSPIYVRVNKLYFSDDFVNKFNVKKTVFDDVFRLDENSSIAEIFNTVEYKNNSIYIQDLGASGVAHVVVNSLTKNISSVKPKIIDMCSAPGGKSLHIASLLNNKAEILSWDIYPHRVNLMQQNVNNYGASCIITECRDSTIFDDKYNNYADVVLLDAPCSGLGTIRRHPDIKIHRKKEDIYSIAKLQQKLLEIASKYLKIGGSLIYSTCTLSSLENELQIEIFLKKHNNFTLVEQNNMNLPISWYNKLHIKNIGISLYPHIHGTDGFYICMMTKNS